MAALLILAFVVLAAILLLPLAHFIRGPSDLRRDSLLLETARAMAQDEVAAALFDIRSEIRGAVGEEAAKQAIDDYRRGSHP